MCGGDNNRANAMHSAVSGGDSNIAGNQDATVSGGCSNNTSAVCDHVP